MALPEDGLSTTPFGVGERAANGFFAVDADITTTRIALAN
jgi:hypothetical protein